MAGERDKLKRDSRWAWMVCFATVIIHLVVSGISNNFGLLYIYIVNELGDGGKAKSAWVGSLSTGITYIIGPLVTASCDRVGCRVTGIVGGLVGVVGLVCSSFTRNVYLLYATYGVAMGVGCGACYVTTVKVLSVWFVRRLALANYFAIAGGFVGNLVIAPCLQRMLATFGLAGTFRLLAGIFSINSLMAVLYRTPQRTREKNALAETKSKTGFDFTVFKHKSYVFYLIGSNVISVAWPITYVHLPAFAKEEGIPEAKVALLVSIDALSGLPAALCFGRIVDYFSNSHLQFYQLSILGIGLVQTFLAAAKTFPSFIVLVIFHGISTAVFIPLRPVLVEDILGKDRASEGVGFLFGTLGFAYIAGPPLVGWIYDVTLSYPIAFFVTGGLCVMACCILSLVSLPQRTIDGTVSSSQDKSRCLLVDESSNFFHKGTPDCTVRLECNNTRLFEGTRETDV